MAVWLRLYHLGVSSLWHDEAHTWWIALRKLPDFLESLRVIGVHPPFYFLLVKASTAVLGESEFGLRLPSLFLDVCAILLAMELGREVGGPAGRIAAGWFWAFHPMTVWYAQDARPYALLAALAAGLLLLFIRLYRSPSRGLWGLALVVLTLGLYTHYYFFLLVGALNIIALVQIRSRPVFFRCWVLVTLGGLALLAPWLVWYFDQSNPTLGIGWIQAPDVGDIIKTIWNLFSGYGGRHSIPDVLFGASAIGLAFFGLISSGRPDRSFVRLSFWAGLAFPIFGIWLISHRRPVYVDRYFIALLPFAAVLVGSGGQAVSQWVLRLREPPAGRSVQVWLLAGFLFIGLLAAWQVHVDGKYTREDWRGLASHLEQTSENRPMVWLSNAESLVPLQYYFRADLKLLSSSDLPACLEPCWWIVRQPYTATHAFSQAITLPGRPWKPDLPPSCSMLDRWESPSGLVLWKIACKEGG